MIMQELAEADERADVLTEMQEAEDLWNQQISNRIGQPALRIKQLLSKPKGMSHRQCECF